MNKLQVQYLFVLFGFLHFFANLHFVQNLLRRCKQSSMQNLECVAQEMAGLPRDTSESLHFDAPDKKILIIF